VKEDEDNVSLFQCTAVQSWLDADSGACWPVTKTAHMPGGSSNIESKSKAKTRRTNAKHTITWLKSQSYMGRKKIIVYDIISE